MERRRQSSRVKSALVLRRSALLPHRLEAELYRRPSSLTGRHLASENSRRGNYLSRVSNGRCSTDIDGSFGLYIQFRDFIRAVILY